MKMVWLSDLPPISVRGCVNPSAIFQGKDVNEKFQRIEPATFWLVAQCLNQLRYCILLVVLSQTEQM